MKFQKKNIEEIKYKNSKFWSKIEIFVNDQSLVQKSKFSPKMKF